jgi:hypothetical protein
MKILLYTIMVLISLGLGFITELCLSDAIVRPIAIHYINIAINGIVLLCLFGMGLLMSYDIYYNDKRDYMILTLLVFFSYIGFGFYINK